jgi:hypothetical protein
MSTLVKGKIYSKRAIETILSTLQGTEANLKSRLAEVQKQIKEVKAYGQEEEIV